jgi:hypothetical protein
MPQNWVNSPAYKGTHSKIVYQKLIPITATTVTITITGQAVQRHDHGIGFRTTMLLNH